MTALRNDWKTERKKRSNLSMRQEYAANRSSGDLKTLSQYDCKMQENLRVKQELKHYGKLEVG